MATSHTSRYLSTVFSVAILILLTRTSSAAHRVATIAGNPCAIGTLDGVGAAARLDAPHGIAWDDRLQTGYVADPLGQVIRGFRRSGELTTVAGVATEHGHRDGPAANALFNYPTDVSVDSLGNLFVADSQNAVIRKINTVGVVSTLAGSPGQPGRSDGSRDIARFVGPVALAVSPSGDVYVVDNNREIRVVSRDGEVRTLAGDQGAAATIHDGWERQARFWSIQSIAVAPSGLIFITDACTVRTITPDGYVSTYAGLPISECFDPVTAAIPAAARFNSPTGIAVDAFANIYVADAGNRVIQRISNNGQVAVIAGSLHANGPPQDGVPGSFVSLRDLAVTRTGELLITEMHRDMPPPCRNGATIRTAEPTARRRAVRH